MSNHDAYLAYGPDEGYEEDESEPAPEITVEEIRAHYARNMAKIEEARKCGC